MLFSLASILSVVAAADLTGQISFPYVQQQQWQNDILAFHNKYRALHGAPALTWNSDLANYALTNAQQYTWAHSGGPYGENIATGSYTDPDVYQFLWYDENQKYDYNNPGFSDATGHFTQMVWVGSQQIGCAMAQQPNGGKNSAGFPYSLTCEYYPRGNIVNAGQFAANVKPLQSSAAAPRASMAVLAAAVVGYFVL